MAVGLAGKRIVIGGGTGDVGIEIVAQLLASGAEVLAIVRDKARAASLGSHASLHLIEGFPNDDDGVAKIAKELGEFGPIHGGIASLGPWFHGPKLTQLPKADWDQMVQASLTSHYLFARAVVPNLVDGGQYLMINGGGALHPVPSSGVVSVLASAQTMLARVLAAEHQNLKIRMLMLLSIIATRARTNPDPSWVTAREVGEKCAWLFADEALENVTPSGAVHETILTAGERK
jgi:NAD(P)-dependent dehydrogenase (short-subunit alcohol dehydrogenase family)